LESGVHDQSPKFGKNSYGISLLALAKIWVALAWVQVYGPRPLFVLRVSSGFAKGFLIAVFRQKIARLGARSVDSVPALLFRELRIVPNVAGASPY
jgi:hypothetical protein